VKLWLKSVILAVAWLAFGAVRMSYEAGLSGDLQTVGLLPPRLAIGTWDHIDQTSTAVALGGLRTLVATFLNLRAFTAFTDRRWDRVEEIYDTIVDLAPHSRYYWENGSWHLAYNAASYYLNDSELPPLRRREAWRTYIVKGRAFLERGIRNNPDDWSLHASLGFLLSDPNKFVACRDPKATFTAAAEAYRKAAETGKAPDHIRRFQCYALARVEGKEAEALALARTLYAEGPKNRTPTQVMLLLVLEAHENPTMNVARRAVELFGTPAKAYAALGAHWQRTRERFPVFGVSGALEVLEKSLSIPPEKSILSRALPVPPNPDDWFGH
jgi:tetratricopeptide (TPR) repeat protein